MEGNRDGEGGEEEGISMEKGRKEEEEGRGSGGEGEGRGWRRGGKRKDGKGRGDCKRQITITDLQSLRLMSTL